MGDDAGGANTEREAAILLLHETHSLVWSGRPHRCRVAQCFGLAGEPTNDRGIWHSEGPPREYHGRGRAIDLPVRLPDEVWRRAAEDRPDVPLTTVPVFDPDLGAIAVIRTPDGREVYGADSPPDR